MDYFIGPQRELGHSKRNIYKCDLKSVLRDSSPVREGEMGFRELNNPPEIGDRTAELSLNLDLIPRHGQFTDCS